VPCSGSSGAARNFFAPDGARRLEPASPANDAETKKPRWGDRGFARTDDPDRGNPWGGMIVLASKRRGCGYDSAEDRDRLASVCRRRGVIMEAIAGVDIPVPTQDSAVSPWPLCLKLSNGSPSPPLRSPPALAPPRLLLNWPSKPAMPLCPASPDVLCRVPAGALCPMLPSSSAGHRQLSSLPACGSAPGWVIEWDDEICSRPLR
jgi:hypothetical protein